MASSSSKEQENEGFKCEVGEQCKKEEQTNGDEAYPEGTEGEGDTIPDHPVEEPQSKEEDEELARLMERLQVENATLRGITHDLKTENASLRARLGLGEFMGYPKSFKSEHEQGDVYNDYSFIDGHISDYFSLGDGDFEIWGDEDAESYDEEYGDGHVSTDGDPRYHNNGDPYFQDEDYDADDDEE